MAVLTASVPSYFSHIRPIDAGRDLPAIADLVDMCFSDTLDPDGQRYLQELRHAARLSGVWGLFTGVDQTPGRPNTGYVWEEAGRIVGNLSLYPFYYQGQPAYLIANVAVHPDYRNRGIGKALTTRAREHVCQHHARCAWLQVRDDNPAATHIYQSLGFEQRAHRVTWQCLPRTPRGLLVDTPENEAPLLEVGKRRSVDWPEQLAWLKRAYPPEVTWHLPLRWIMLDPGLGGGFQRFMALNFPRHWVVRRQGETLGILSWQESQGYADHLWLALPKLGDDLATLVLLRQALRDLPPKRTLLLNYPVSVSTFAIQSAGFTPLHTLLWMSFVC